MLNQHLISSIDFKHTITSIYFEPFLYHHSSTKGKVKQHVS